MFRSPNDFRPVRVEHFAAWLVGTFVSMGTEEVALGLKQVGRQEFAPVAVVVAEGGAEGRNWNAGQCGYGDKLPPVFLGVIEDVLEERG